MVWTSDHLQTAVGENEDPGKEGEFFSPAEGEESPHHHVQDNEDGSGEMREQNGNGSSGESETKEFEQASPTYGDGAPQEGYSAASLEEVGITDEEQKEESELHVPGQVAGIGSVQSCETATVEEPQGYETAAMEECFQETPDELTGEGALRGCMEEEKVLEVEMPCKEQSEQHVEQRTKEAGRESLEQLHSEENTSGHTQTLEGTHQPGEGGESLEEAMATSPLEPQSEVIPVLRPLPSEPQAAGCRGRGWNWRDDNTRQSE